MHIQDQLVFFYCLFDRIYGNSSACTFSMTGRCIRTRPSTTAPHRTASRRRPPMRLLASRLLKASHICVTTLSTWFQLVFNLKFRYCLAFMTISHVILLQAGDDDLAYRTFLETDQVAQPKFARCCLPLSLHFLSSLHLLCAPFCLR